MADQIIYNSVGIVEVPLDTKILVKKAYGDYNFDDLANVMTMNSDHWNQDTACEWLLGGGFTLWALI